MRGLAIGGLLLGACLGATLRYLVGTWAAARFGSGFPYGTLAVNLVGCFILGLFSALVAARPEISPPWRLLIATGFCGSLTTFSTYSLETIMLLEQGAYLRAVGYAVGSLLVGLLAVIGGLQCGRVLQ